MLNRLYYRVLYASSEHERDSSKDLASPRAADLTRIQSEFDTKNGHSRGWTSSRNCKFPQEIGLELPTSVFINQIRIVAHNLMVPSKGNT